MKVDQAIALIRGAFQESSQPERWADFGCGDGFFTRVLGTLLPQGSTIYAVDKRSQVMHSLPSVAIEFNRIDFEYEPLPLNELDGIFMANSLHYVKDKASFLRNLKSMLTYEGKLLVVEYELAKANPWVPYPISFG